MREGGLQIKFSYNSIFATTGSIENAPVPSRSRSARKLLFEVDDFSYLIKYSQLFAK